MLIVLWILPLTFAGAQAQPLRVLATSPILADVARSVGGDLVTVDSLIPTGADGHAWQPTPADMVKVAQADLVLAVGIGYETFLGQFVDSAAAVPQVVVSNGILILPFGDHAADQATGAAGETGSADQEYAGVYGEPGVCDNTGATAEVRVQCDPHVWTDPNNVMIWAANTAEAFAAADPANAGAYRASADAYIEQLKSLDADVESLLAVVPDERRVLVTNHEFLGYFARRYGFRVAGGILGATTLDEPDPRRLAALADAVKASGVPVIFAEVSASSPFAQVIAREAGITVVSDLYSESLSDANGPAPTYPDYLRYNAERIAAALAPE